MNMFTCSACIYMYIQHTGRPKNIELGFYSDLFYANGHRLPFNCDRDCVTVISNFEITTCMRQKDFLGLLHPTSYNHHFFNLNFPTEKKIFSYNRK